MKRSAVVFALCALLGVATAVAVAWGFKLYYCFFTPGMSAGGMLVEGNQSYTMESWEGIGRKSYWLKASTLLIEDDPSVQSVITNLKIARAELASSGDSQQIQTQLSEFNDTLARLENTQRAIEASRGRRINELRAMSVPAPPVWVARPTGGAGVTEVAAGAYGWPVPCLAGEIRVVAGTRTEMKWHWLVTTWRPAGGVIDLAMPLRPLPLATAVDTAFYGALWGGVFMGRPALRRWRRRKRGLCPTCAYDVRGEFEKGCPECGWGRTG